MQNGNEDFTRFSATRLSQLMVKGELSPVELMRACLAQVERHNGSVNAICTLSETAMQEAHEAEQRLQQGGDLGILHGLPVGIKDVTATAGLRTTFGAPLYSKNVPEVDAVVVQRLKKAGAIVLGKTNTPEFAAGAHTDNRVFGVTRNPWNLSLSAGGSTGGGAAALATGMICLADGTDLGGSLRVPASFCGVVGLRPSPGLVPVYPSAFPWDNLQSAGPMARFAEDVGLMLQAMCGPSPLTPPLQSAEGRDFVAAVRSKVTGTFRLAYCPDIAGIDVDPQIESVCRKAAFGMEDYGFAVEEVSLDLSFARKAFLALRGLWMVAHHFDHLDKLEHFGKNLSGNIRAGLGVTTRELAAAEKARARLWEIFYKFFLKWDFLLTPCTAVPPFPVDINYPETIAGKKMETYIDWIAPTFVLSLTGLPAVSVPCGLDVEKLPVGLQIVGPSFGEESVLALTKQIQDANPLGFPP